MKENVAIGFLHGREFTTITSQFIYFFDAPEKLELMKINETECCYSRCSSYNINSKFPSMQ